MTKRIACEFILVRYVPDVVKGEFVNIGIALSEISPPGEEVNNVQVRFTRDWRRVLCLDKGADIAMLEALEAEFAGFFGSELPGGRGPWIAQLADILSNSIQMSVPRACLAESMTAEIDQLMRLYVDLKRTKISLWREPRAEIVFSLRSEFEKAKVWSIMRKRISASLYTGTGDSMILDCGYRPNGVLRIFQAVSLVGDLNGARALAHSAPELFEGVQRKESCSLDLVAVVETDYRQIGSREEGDYPSKETMERYQFVVDTLDCARIRVVPRSGLGRLAETARIELGLGKLSEIAQSQSMA